MTIIIVLIVIIAIFLFLRSDSWKNEIREAKIRKARNLTKKD